MSGPFGSSQWMYNASSGFYSYKINQSLRFNDGDSPYLTRDPSSAGDRQKFTYSVWFKRSAFQSGPYPSSSSEIDLFSAGDSSTDRFEIILSAAYPDQLEIYMNTSGTIGDLLTTQVFRDVSAWYHLVVAFDTTQSTASNRVKVYINGSQITSFATETYPSQNFNTAVNSTSNQYISKRNYVDDRYYDGYMAEVNMIDGQQLTPSSFGETKDGVWVPKSSSGLTFGTNGFYLPFDDSSAIGDDESSNTNDFTANNLAATDVVPDSPTNNFGTLNPLAKHSGTTQMSEGNLAFTSQFNNDWECIGSTMHVSSGKWYCEVAVTTASSSLVIRDFVIGVARSASFTFLDENTFYTPASNYGYYASVGDVYSGGSVSGDFNVTYGQGDIIGIAIDMDNLAVYFAKNNTYLNSGDPTSGASKTGLSGALLAGASYEVAVGAYLSGQKFTANFGQDSSFAGTETAQGNADGNGQGDFYYAPPSGYLALCTANLPDPTIGPTADTLATDNFNTVLYTGNATGRNITGVGFQPDWVWIKPRSYSDNNVIFDSVRGVNKTLYANTSGAESDRTGNDSLTAFGSDGYTIGDWNNINTNNGTLVAWNWKAGGSASSNSDGDITSSVSANTAAGFSIGTYTGNGQGSQTIGHGLSSAPGLVIIKQRSGGNDWVVFDKFRPDTEKYLRLNENNGYYDYGAALMATPGASTFELTYAPSGYTNDNGATYVFYAFHSVDGYSKVGTYTGNGNNDGPFVFTGFRPAFVLVKDTSVGNGWRTADNKRPAAFNVINESLSASSSGAASTTDGDRIDFLSNGFKCRSSAGQYNDNNSKYIYIAFAEAPFKFANAR